MADNIRIKIERVIPILNVKDISVSRKFYKEMLGFREAAWGSEHFTCMEMDKAALYLSQGSQGSGVTWVWLGFDGDIHALHGSLSAKGVKIRQAPVNYSWALEMDIEDPDGHILRLGTEPESKLPFADQN